MRSTVPELNMVRCGACGIKVQFPLPIVHVVAPAIAIIVLLLVVSNAWSVASAFALAIAWVAYVDFLHFFVVAPVKAGADYQ